MKLTAMICVIVSCTMCGHALAGTSARRRKLLAEMISALRLLRIELGSLLHPLESALRQAHFPLFILISEQLPEEKCVFDAWQTVQNRECSRGGMADSLSSRDLSALDRLFEYLGTSGREEQIEAIQGCIMALDESLAEAKEHSVQVGQLYTSLGFLSGLALAILMI